MSRNLNVQTEQLLRYVDESCSYGELLNIFSAGSVRDGTMTITIIPNKEDFFEQIRNQSVPISLELNLLRGSIA